MANFEAVTSSNTVELNDVNKYNMLMEKYRWICDVDGRLDGTFLTIFGYDWPFVELSPVEDDYDDNDRFDEFLAELAPLLKTPLIIQSIGAEKCRFPLDAMQVIVYPDGKIEWFDFLASAQGLEKKKEAIAQ